MGKKFNNRENISIKYDGKEYWISRSVAVVGVVIAITNFGTYVLVTQRSKKMDHPHKLCVPCGYLDWNENSYDAMVREVYEETSLYLPEYDDIIKSDKKPFFIQDDPTKDVKQNISFLFCTIMDFINQPIEFPLCIEKFRTDETDAIKWIPIDLIVNSPNTVWAFNHNEIINYALQCFNIRGEIK
jgi:8-oxo-dGTP pyrophosphatase MutT (NUDIX family)